MMLDTLRRVDALLDRMSFLGVSSGNSNQNMVTIGMIINDMSQIVKAGGLKYEDQVVSECEVHYSHPQYTINVYWNGDGRFACDIRTHSGQLVDSLTASSVITLANWLKAKLGIN